MKSLMLSMCCVAVLCLSSFAHAEEPAILAELGQSYAVADAATLDKAQGAWLDRYLVTFNFPGNYLNDSRSRLFRNWSVVPGSLTRIQTSATGTIYLSQNLSQLIWNQSTSAGSAWCTSY